MSWFAGTLVSMSQQLPPLNALRAFEAVARHLSFTRAAAELNVTRAAISHQVKSLEEFLGFHLLERNHRSITLTREAVEALPKLQQGFACLTEAVQLLRGGRQVESLTVWAAPSFVSKWLIPRLHHFSSRHPEIDMQISGNADLVDIGSHAELGTVQALFRKREVDVIIHFGSEQNAGQSGDKLFSVSAVPLCSPRLISASALHPLKTPQDLIHHTLLHDDTDYAGRPDWSSWLAWQGVEGVNASRGLHFNQVSLAMEAAIDGQGVLLSMMPLAQSDIDAGRLCIPFAVEMPLDYAYYIICPENSGGNSEAIHAFIRWLKEEALR